MFYSESLEVLNPAKAIREALEDDGADIKKCIHYVKHQYSNRYGYCYATKSCSLCNCNGDESKCDYYPEKRNKNMTTLEMMDKAKETGKTYRADDALYNTKLGFHDQLGRQWAGSAFTYLNELFSIDNWEEDPRVYMTKSEAEEKYGIKIVP